MTLVKWNFSADIILPKHAYENKQITKIISEEFELILDGEKIELKACSSIIIPSNNSHSGKSLTECHIIDIFCQVRDNFKSYSE